MSCYPFHCSQAKHPKSPKNGHSSKKTTRTLSFPELPTGALSSRICMPTHPSKLNVCSIGPPFRQHPSFFAYYPANVTFEGIIADMHAAAITNPGFNVSDMLDAVIRIAERSEDR